MRVALRLFAFVLLAAVLPTSAHAVATTTVDIKAHPSVFKAGNEVDVPVHFVENRAGTDASQLTGAKLYAVKADFATTHSRFVSFTPDPGFDDDTRSFPTNQLIQYVRINNSDPNKSRLYFYIRTKTTGGLPITVDNSGITGRTEVFVGTLRIAVGPVVEARGRKVVFDTAFYDDPSAGYPIATLLKPGCICNLNSMAAKRIQVFDDDAVPEGIAPGDGNTPTPTPTTPAPTTGDAPGAAPPPVITGPTAPCTAAQGALKRANTTLAAAKKLATTRAKQAKRKPSARTKKAAKQAQTALKKAQTALKSAQKKAKTAC